MNKIRFNFIYPMLAFLCVALSGCRALPERNNVGMTRDQVIEAYGETTRDTENELIAMTVWNMDSGYPWNRTGTPRGLHFKAVDEIRENEIVRRSSELGIYERYPWSDNWFHYETVFENKVVMRQKIVAHSDGSIVWLPDGFSSIGSKARVLSGFDVYPR